MFRSSSPDHHSYFTIEAGICHLAAKQMIYNQVTVTTPTGTQTTKISKLLEGYLERSHSLSSVFLQALIIQGSGPIEDKM